MPAGAQRDRFKCQTRFERRSRLHESKNQRAFCSIRGSRLPATPCGWMDYLITTRLPLRRHSLPLRCAF